VDWLELLHSVNNARDFPDKNAFYCRQARSTSQREFLVRALLFSTNFFSIFIVRGVSKVAAIMGPLLPAERVVKRTASIQIKGAHRMTLVAAPCQGGN
jgi:hypothetical protein